MSVQTQWRKKLQSAAQTSAVRMLQLAATRMVHGNIGVATKTWQAAYGRYARQKALAACQEELNGSCTELADQLAACQAELNESVQLQCTYKRGLRICTMLLLATSIHKTKLKYFSAFKVNSHLAIAEQELINEMERGEELQKENNENSALVDELDAKLSTFDNQA